LLPTHTITARDPSVPPHVHHPRTRKCRSTGARRRAAGKGTLGLEHVAETSYAPGSTCCDVLSRRVNQRLLILASNLLLLKVEESSVTRARLVVWLQVRAAGGQCGKLEASIIRFRRAYYPLDPCSSWAASPARRRACGSLWRGNQSPTSGSKA
jgi:hypothetical protein